MALDDLKVVIIPKFIHNFIFLALGVLQRSGRRRRAKRVQDKQSRHSMIFRAVRGKHLAKVVGRVLVHDVMSSHNKARDRIFD